MLKYYKIVGNCEIFKVILFNENKFINQKCFYCDNDDTYKIVLIKTKEKIKIKKKEKEQLMNYLKEKNINIEYFEKFEGFVNIIITESLNSNYDYLIKGISLHFLNNLYESNKNIYLLVENKKDIEIILLILEYYLKHLYIYGPFNILVDSTCDEKLNLELSKRFFFYSFLINKNLNFLKKYFKKYLNLSNYINKLNLNKNSNNFKNYIYIKKKEKINLEKFNKIYSYYENLLDFTGNTNTKEYLLNFEGLVFLVEMEFIINDRKIKRFFLFFFDINTLIYNAFGLFTRDILEFSINIIKTLWVVNEYFNEENYNISLLEDKICDFNLYKGLDYNNIFEENNDIIIFAKNIKILKLFDLKILIFYLEFYNLFIF